MRIKYIKKFIKLKIIIIMKIKKILFLSSLLFLSIYSYSQYDYDCNSFAKTGLEVLNSEEFIHDGHFNSMKLNEGNQMIIIKPFYKGRKYQIVAISKENLPGINFVLQQNSSNIYYKTKTTNNKQIYTFLPKKSENLTIILNVAIGDAPNPYNSGCVTILVGYSARSYN